MLTVIAAAIGFFSVFSVDSNNTAGKFSPDAPQPQQQTKSEPTAETQPDPKVKTLSRSFWMKKLVMQIWVLNQIALRLCQFTQEKIHSKSF